MKTSKTGGTSKPKRSLKAGDAAKEKKVATKKSVPTVDEIRLKAREIYYERISRGEPGTEEGDWLEAEEILRGSKQ
jgi:hypothetical protein